MTGRDRVAHLMRQLASAACRCPAHSHTFHQGIANRALRPVLGIVDPLHTLHMPSRVAANSGFDVLCHALESYTALPYSDSVCVHGMSYPIAGNVKTYRAKEYSVDHPVVPHGLSVVVTSPAVFSFTASMCPDRHLEAAQILGADISNVKRADAGSILADTLRSFLFDLQVDDGLSALGYNKDDIPALVKGTLPQERVTKLSPRPHTEEDLTELFTASMKLY
ncbi:hydroxyacid-oxoacid transhydrogenase, mitochondrial [Alosa alosa]|uniref:hydroxyacid-oxoacid transhydrogenase, mitochondrial n=1 Tax=Alosa alosa TaxID=278164 RepID=UPI0020152F12|nr:hydroxyacid-oxoacid transhydrogenase, mitochondrial [Alosa alosa]